MFNRILFAIDLSDQPQRIYRYGIDLSSQLGCNLELVYIFHPSQLKGRLRSGKSPAYLKTYFQQRVEQLEPAESPANKEISGFQSALVPKSVVEGFPDKELLKYSKSGAFDLIALGIKSFNYPFNEEFGHVVSEIAHEASCPILLLPSDVSYTGFRKILFVADSKKFDPSSVEHAIGISYLFNAELRGFHVYYDDDQEHSLQINQELKEQLEGMATDLNYDYKIAPVQEMLAEMNQFILEEDIDLVYFFSYNRYLWSNFLKEHMKETYQLAKNLPILIHHLDND